MKPGLTRATVGRMSQLVTSVHSLSVSLNVDTVNATTLISTRLCPLSVQYVKPGSEGAYVTYITHYFQWREREKDKRVQYVMGGKGRSELS